jgi:hypothetical protein
MPLEPQKFDGDPRSALFDGRLSYLCVELDGRWNPCAPRPAALLPGSFNPLHEGHRLLARAAADLLGMPVAFELSIANVDKASLGQEEVRRRLAPFAWQADVWLTRAPTFVEKARLFPKAVFVVGVDTAARIMAPRYYARAADTAMVEALTEIRESGCRFLVAGRVDKGGLFVELADLPIPAHSGDLFQALSRQAFRADISSTHLRATTGVGPA